jgi:biopolymer transport protein ExbB/biopolymer transport protein TolQ
MQLSLLELWNSMGWFAKGIVFVLFGMSVFAAAIAIRKALELRRARRATLQFSDGFSRALAADDFGEAAALVATHKASHLAAAFRGVMENLAAFSKDRRLSAVEIASIQRTIELNALEQLANLRRGLGVLATIGSTAPFVGLLGTTMGVVNAFTGMATAGSGGLSAISAGIAEALITTAFGLFVAIPAVWLYNYFVNRIEYVGMEIQYGAKEFTDFLLRFESRIQGRVEPVGNRSPSMAAAHDRA